MMSKKKDICAGVSCCHCWSRDTCPDSPYYGKPKKEKIPPSPAQKPRSLHNKYRPRRQRIPGKPLIKKNIYFGLGKKYGYKCWICGDPELVVEDRGETLEIHRLNEGNNGGSYMIWNCRLVCTRCHYGLLGSWQGR